MVFLSDAVLELSFEEHYFRDAGRIRKMIIEVCNTMEIGKIKRHETIHFGLVLIQK